MSPVLYQGNLDIPLENQVTRYLQAKTIAAHGFACPFWSECSGGSPLATQAREPSMGLAYVEHLVPRLCCASSDPGYSHPDPDRRTIAASRADELVCDPNTLPKNGHWYHTHDLTLQLLRPFVPGLTLADTCHYFAHTNSARCCRNNPGKAQAPWVMFRNCQRYLRGELEVLAPDILVTQGQMARAAVEASWPGITLPGIAPTGYGLLPMQGRQVVWFHTPHPRRRADFYPQRAYYPAWAEALRQLIPWPPA